MPTEHHDFIGFFATPDFGDHIPVGHHATLGRGHFQTQCDRTATGHLPGNASGVFRGEGCVRDLGHPVLIAHGSGVRRPQGIIGHRTNEAGHGTRLGRLDGSLGSEADGLAVLGERHIEDNNPTPDLGGPLRQLGKIGHHADRSGDATGRRAHTATQAQHRKSFTAGRQHLDRLEPAFPAGHDHRFPMDILQPVAAHPLQNPIHGGFQSR